MNCLIDLCMKMHHSSVKHANIFGQGKLRLNGKNFDFFRAWRSRFMKKPRVWDVIQAHSLAI